MAISSEERARVTFRWDLVRGASHGILDPIWSTFFLLVAIRVFAADDSVKQFLPAAHGIGLALTPVTLSLLSRLKVPVSRLLSFLWLGLGLTLIATASVRSLPLYVGVVILYQLIAAQGVPFLTQIFSANYPSSQRGRRLAVANMVLSVTGVLFSLVAGWLLDHNLSWYPAIFITAAAAAFIGSFAISRMPTESAHHMSARNPWTNLKYIWEDKTFGLILGGWMLMGLGNLMTIPIRIEYMANPAYGVNATNEQIAFTLVFLVSAARILSAFFWGRVFDHFNLIVVRVILNFFFLFSVFLFFQTDSLLVMGISTTMLGAGFGGAGIMWQLWVTKVTTPERVPAYMSIHGALTGVRATAAPFLGYFLVGHTHPTFLAWCACVLIGLSTMIFLPARHAVEAIRRSEAENVEPPEVRP